MQTGLITDVPQAILQAFPVATKVMYVVACRDAERLKGDLVNLLQQVLLIQVKGSSSVQARMQRVVSIGPVIQEGHCLVIPPEVLFRSGVNIIPQDPQSVHFLLCVYRAKTLSRLLQRCNILMRIQNRILSMDPAAQDILGVPHPPVPAPTGAQRPFRATCLNVQHSIKSSIPQLENFLREQHFPAIVLLTESGVPPSSMSLDNRYHRFSHPVRRGQIGTAILLLKDSGTTVHR